MELAYPWVLLVAVVVAFILVLVKVKPFKFKQGNKVANTDDVTLTATYKKLFTKYKIYRSIMLVSLMLALASGFVLGARIISVDTIYPKIHNRDIFLCLDVSNSVDDLNLQIVDEYIELVLDYISLLPSDLVLERFVSSSPRSLLVAPHWDLKNYEFAERVRKAEARRL